MERKREAVKYIISRIIAGERDLRKLKNEAGKRFSLNEIPKNTELWSAFPKSKLTDEIKLLLLRKPVRTISGVSPIAIMIKPEGSCRFRCIYCPFTGKAAKSYTGEEPAALRARQNNFDPSKQVKTRLEQFRIGGHPSEKCEVIAMGGTFLQMERKYKYGFIKSVYDALNGRESRNLELAKKKNETAKHRAIGLTIETRPDICRENEINEMLEFGATRVELGVQNPNDTIYRTINRGHTVKDVEIATRLLKDSSFKVLYHIMPGLPGSSPSKDVQMVKKLFEDERFKPDMLKIYPTLVMPATELYKMYENGRYEPYSTEQAADVISEFFRYIPKYVRVMRIQRDIPSGLIAGGVSKSNLREFVETKIRKKKINPQEIRWREIGFAKMDAKTGKFKLKRMDYQASNGKEIFISFENETTIAGFVRLRNPYEPFRKELDGAGLVREFHVYGNELEIGKREQNARLETRDRKSAQHEGYGNQLLAEAERIVKEEFGFRKIAIISGVGVREYFYRKGYAKDGPYVSRKI